MLTAVYVYMMKINFVSKLKSIDKLEVTGTLMTVMVGDFICKTTLTLSMTMSDSEV